MKTGIFSRGFIFRFSLILVLAVGLFAMPDLTAHAATDVVTNDHDSGAGSLRQAIANAAAGDTITFDNDYTITLTSASLTVAKDMTIDGTGHSVSISGNNVRSVFIVNSGVTASLTGLTILDGNSWGNNGGGIDNAGALTITNSTISGNSAPGGIGAGIYSSGTLTVQDSTISGNSAIGGGGGAIFNDGGTLTVQN
ncbi:MAG: hypothetical protein WCE68_00645, partial [Anaerolineales bacterium]